jgi:hypothetical protein
LTGSHNQGKSERRPSGIRPTSSTKAKRLKSESKQERQSDNWSVPDISPHEGALSTPYPDLGAAELVSLGGSSELFPDSAITPLELDESDLGIMMSDVCGIAPDDIQLSEIVDTMPVCQKTVNSGGSSSTDWKARQTASKQVQDLLEGRVSSQRDVHNRKPKRKKKLGETVAKSPLTKRKSSEPKTADPVHQMAEANRVKSSFKIPKRCDSGSQSKVSSLPSPPSASQPPPHIPPLIHYRSMDQFSSSYHSNRQSEHHMPPPALISTSHYTPSQQKSISYPPYRERQKSEPLQMDTKKDQRRTASDLFPVMAEGPKQAQTKKSIPLTRTGKIDSDMEVSGLARKQWLLIFRCLSQPDLCNCMLVCQAFYAWAQDPCLWHSLNLSRIDPITAPMLTGIRKRQPRVLDLSFTGVTQRQLQWLLKKLNLLNSLYLAGCNKPVLSALMDCSPFPPIHHLDLGWADGLDDHSVQGLIVGPSHLTDKPMSVKQLRSLKELRLTGSQITDTSLQLVSRHSSCLVKLDCSYCSALTDHAIEWLTSVGSPSRNTLQDIDLSGCSKLTDLSIHYLSRCSHLARLDLGLCDDVSLKACESLVASSNLPLTLKENKLIELKDTSTDDS